MAWRLCRLRFNKPVLPPAIQSEVPSATSVASQSVKGLKGQPFNPEEHFLLADLDFGKDAALFGNSREEFYENVERLKNVIITYHRWEQRDHYYKWSTWILRFMCFGIGIDILYNMHCKKIFRASLQDYKQISNDEIESLCAKRKKDFRAAASEIVNHPPTFAQPSAPAVTRRSPMDTSQREKEKEMKEREEVKSVLAALNVDGGSGLSLAAAPTSTPLLKELRRILLPQSDDFVSVVKEEILCHQQSKAAKLRYPQPKSSSPS